MGDKVLKLVETAGNYYNKINGVEQLSLSTGTLLMDLVAQLHGNACTKASSNKWGRVESRE